ncbi:glycoside hydrolase, family 32 [Artemisia annua]|uniref:Glycoside hydrolase, family 32 n=1 Tax=Artemisia annua TaxID=35608 RepID=A0A2U1MH76_ARTAN|nr:glycoside hydrolase, family 32 [Artemisia annua]
MMLGGGGEISVTDSFVVRIFEIEARTSTEGVQRYSARIKTVAIQWRKKGEAKDYVGESDTVDEGLSRGWATLFTGTHLIHCRVEETDSLRSHGQEFKEIKLEASSIVPLDIGSATQVDNEYGCTTSFGAAQRGILGPFGIAVLADGTLSEFIPVYFYIAKNIDAGLATHYCTDKVSASVDYASERVVYGSIVPVRDAEELTMRILKEKDKANLKKKITKLHTYRDQIKT